MPSAPTIKSTVRFHFPHKGSRLSDRSRLKVFIADLFKKERKRLAELDYVFCSDAYLLDVNRQFLGHDYYTDIITFDLSEPGKAINAEVYISVDRVRENAGTFSTTIQRELHRVIFHGALHLCGFSDKKAQERAKMRKKEDKYLDLYFGG